MPILVGILFIKFNIVKFRENDNTWVMDQKQKDQLFADAQSQVGGTVKNIVSEIPKCNKRLNSSVIINNT